MRFFKHLRRDHTEDVAKTETSKALLEEVIRTEPEVQEQHQQALARLREAEEQAQRLKAADHRNHYSESLTHAFRGRTA